MNCVLGSSPSGFDWVHRASGFDEWVPEKRNCEATERKEPRPTASDAWSIENETRPTKNRAWPTKNEARSTRKGARPTEGDALSMDNDARSTRREARPTGSDALSVDNDTMQRTNTALPTRETRCQREEMLRQSKQTLDWEEMSPDERKENRLPLETTLGGQKVIRWPLQATLGEQTLIR